MGFEELAEQAAEAGALLVARQETVAVAESSAGGLISAVLLSVPGASAYFKGGAVVYTAASKQILAGMDEETLRAHRPATEAHALDLARAARERLGTHWGIGETGAAGPTGNRYGDPAGHACIGVVGPVSRAVTLQTGSADRAANMAAFTRAALELLAACVREAAA